MQNRIDGVLLKSQQAYMKKLGFYTGAIDGFWGPTTKAAMVAFRDSAKFAPANKRRADGPFIPFERLPKGFSWSILDGQRCMLADSNLPSSFAVQELVNLMTEPTTAKVEIPAPAITKVENANQPALSPVISEASKTAAAGVLEDDESQNQAASATEGQSAKGSSNVVRPQHPHQQKR